jgi:cysteine desulfurase
VAEPIYLDYNATTPVAPQVLEAMLPWMTDHFWNAASSHRGGRSAARAVDGARAQLAELIGCSPRELVWTSGATEANNLALQGVVEHAQPGSTILVASTEHKAVLDTAHAMEKRGFVVKEIPVGRDGVVEIETLRVMLDDSVALVSIMLANNETGVLQPIAPIAELVHESGSLLHTDATQAVGKIPVNLAELGVDLASVSAHKFYGPKGVGALFVRRGVRLGPVMHGGGHESGLRSGTLNVPGIVGIGAASEMAGRLMPDAVRRGRALVDRLTDGLVKALPAVTVVAEQAQRLPNTINIRFGGADAEAVMAHVPDVYVSTGSACTASVPDASHVLQNMGMTQEAAFECLRFSVGRPTTSEQIDTAVERVSKAVGRVRQLMHGTDFAEAGQGVNT